MASRVLVPMDESELAERALSHALDTYPDATITVLHVVGGASRMMGDAVSLALEDDVEEAAREEAEPVFERARELAAGHDGELELRIGYGKPGSVIVEHADAFDAVVIGNHDGSLVDRLITGNVAQEVVRGSSVPVTTVGDEE